MTTAQKQAIKNLINNIKCYDFHIHPEAKIPCIREQQKLINPGVNARQQVLDTVAEFSKIPNIVHSFFEPK